ncbi:hypothetical protein [Aeromonas hydrophila]|uniref:hypothetical protein n=1 Tax=Aeromonas hydrophila TaxID=644 RepID=UPI000AE3E0A9|nr:hypothetical protein [Aeromonas hydrophila]QWL80234.1 hypothetical protein HQ395_16465 [Aeromonas hydrophila]
MDIINCWKELFEIKSQCTTYHFFKDNGRKYELIVTLIVFVTLLVSLLFVLPQGSGLIGLIYSYIYVVVSSLSSFMLNARVRYRIGIIRFGKHKLSLRDAELYAKHEMFRCKFESNEMLKASNIGALLEWGESRFTPKPAVEGLLTKLFLAVFGVVIAFALGLDAVKEIMVFVLRVIVEVLPVVLALVFGFKEVFCPINKRYANICRDLKWIEIARKEAMTHFELNGCPRKPLLSKVD